MCLNIGSAPLVRAFLRPRLWIMTFSCWKWKLCRVMLLSASPEGLELRQPARLARCGIPHPAWLTSLLLLYTAQQHTRPHSAKPSHWHLGSTLPHIQVTSINIEVTLLGPAQRLDRGPCGTCHVTARPFRTPDGCLYKRNSLSERPPPLLTSHVIIVIFNRVSHPETSQGDKCPVTRTHRDIWDSTHHPCFCFTFATCLSKWKLPLFSVLCVLTCLLWKFDLVDPSVAVT